MSRYKFIVASRMYLVLFR